MESLKLSNKKAIWLIISYVFGYSLILPLFGLVISLYNQFDLIIVSWVLDFIYLLIVYYACRHIIKEGLARFKANFLSNVIVLVKQVFLIMVVNVLCSLILYLLFSVEGSQNQSQINELMLLNYPYTFFATVIFAPLVEETVFRLCIFRGLYKNRFWGPAIISSLLFGFIHVFSSFILGNYLDLANIITYSMMGLVICRYYYQSDNIVCAMLLHMMNNLIGTLLFLV
ncbi:MAG: CPBP family intramembrane metalloprotease [Erysipelotrichaceae bacterium]|nr:CPBP family intramembrane metalloprotease [Erysipelotrichaceae bacterium]MDY5251836.1 type II CAAX endopeptidase family protein [Erysipelotrichaceae bacterium]